jgi:hypothetical protein
MVKKVRQVAIPCGLCGMTGFNDISSWRSVFYHGEGDSFFITGVLGQIDLKEAGP